MSAGSYWSSDPDTEALMPSPEVVSSAENALVLVAALSERGRLRVADAAQLLSVTPPTAHRLLSTLKRLRFAEQDRQRVYFPGPLLKQLGVPQERRADLGSVAHPHLAALSTETEETVHLVTLEGNGSRFVDGVESTHALRVGSRVGLLLPAHTTSGGKVLLACLTDAELTALYPTGQVPMRDGSVRDLAGLRRELSVVRRNDYALNLEESERGVNAIGIPVTGHHGKAVAALVLACPSIRSSRQTLVSYLPSMQATAAAIARGLPRLRSGEGLQS
ncbi:IclR family transcriptional regulator [Kribbella sp. NPDC050820]|uniref:IclR family transcriptional regulator n=1 Tax=Kribbella sp. NPDC050820 TaxID=3155408 RepID=UPI0033FCE821